MEYISRLGIEELEAVMAELSEKKYAARQIYSWIHQKNAQSFSEMSDVSKGLREKLSKAYSLTEMRIIKKLKSQDGTVKYLFALKDGHTIEAVLMHYSHGYALCCSTQVGCKMGCTFCASTVGGFVRNLSFDEIAAQVYAANKDEGVKVGNIVLMGSGEPLINYDNTVEFIKLMTGGEGQNISQRNITLSTCGIIEGIERLSYEKIQDKKLQITLAISLHAATDDKRQMIMPVAKRYKTIDLVDACRHYANITKRRVTYEYALIKGFNDSADDAKELAKLLKGSLCHVNLIPVNPVLEAGLKRPSQMIMNKFSDTLKSSGIEATFRRELGSDINAACGQLRNSEVQNGF